jgi:hypothetical protein
MGDIFVQPDPRPLEQDPGVATETALHSLEFSTLDGSGPLGFDPILSDPFTGLDLLNPPSGAVFGLSDQTHPPDPFSFPASIQLPNPSVQANISSQPGLLAHSNLPPNVTFSSIQSTNIPFADLDVAANSVINLATALDTPLPPVDNIQASGQPLHNVGQDIPMDDIDDELRLIELERREIELRALKKQRLQSQADCAGPQASSSTYLPRNCLPWTTATDIVEQDCSGIIDQGCLGSRYPVEQRISHQVVLPATPSLDLDISCLPPGCFSPELNDPFYSIPSIQQNTMSAEPTLEQIVELSDKELAESSSGQPLRPSLVSQDQITEPRLQQSRMTLVERSRRKKEKREIPGSLCFQLNGVSGPVKAKKVRSKEALDRTKAIKKLGACLYCRYLKKTVGDSLLVFTYPRFLYRADITTVF